MKFILLLALVLGTSLATVAQTCGTSTTPTLSGQSWKDKGTKNVYIDPTLPAAMQTSIKQAATDFGTQTGQSINVLAAGASDPGSSTQDAIRIMNSPSGSPTSFSKTSTVVASAGGGATQVSATISFNTGANLAPASGGSPAVPFYSPTQPNASQYVYDVTLHELDHAFGLNDAPVPNDPTTGEPDYSLQPAGASIMNGSVNTNDQGPHGTASTPQPGGIGATSVQPCDKQQISTANPAPTPASPPAGSGGGGSGSGGGNSGGSGGGVSCTGYDDWDDSSNTVTHHEVCTE